MGVLWNTFGATGIASAAAWAAALVAVAIAFARPAAVRFRTWAAAAAVALLGVVLAAATSASIRSIEVDRSAEVRAAEEAAARAAQDKLRGRASQIRFAEDTAADQADVAGVSVAEARGTYERAIEEQIAKLPAYRSRGRQTRSSAAGKAPDRSGPAKPDPEKPDPGTPAAEQSAEASPAAAEKQEKVRRLPEADLIVADRYDRINRLIAWLTLGLSVGLVGIEYARRFNSTSDAVWPLPLAGTFVDGLFPKRHLDGLPVGGGAEVWRRFADDCVRKGESFILFADSDPLPDRDALDRLPIGTGRWAPAWLRGLLAPLRPSLPKRAFAAADVAADPALEELVFETAWFGRAAFVLVGGSGADRVLAGLVQRLERRRACRAASRRTLTIAWALGAPVPCTSREVLAILSEPMNLRTIAPGDVPGARR
jgi:hypothetical protein